MLEVAAFGVLAGLDNLQVSAALGVSRPRRGRLLALAGAFAACEAFMPLVGLALGGALRRSVPALEAAGPLVLLIFGGAILVHARREGDAREVVEGRWMMGLPISLSLDNLFAGVGLGSAGYPLLASALMVGAISCTMCIAGLFAGTWLRRWVPGRAEVWSGAFLVALALVSLARGAV
ncbi:MAG TPA: manganese efflux pump [Longimicrobium sp.]|nr:manganese efflux pump [Longimicrobium sp.]